jgi:short-subunit dehydrogenase
MFSPRKVFITGANGSLGSELVNIFQKNNVTTNRHFYKQEGDNNQKIVFGDISTQEVQNQICQRFISTNSNVLINNVGMYLHKPISEISDDEIINLMNVNLISTMLITKNLLSYLVSKNGGMIYNINSVAGLNGSKYESIYCASKFGLKGFTDSLIKEFNSQKNIRIVNVTLGAFKSKMTEQRSNYSELAEPNEVAHKIYSHIMEDYKTINTDISIYRK